MRLTEKGRKKDKGERTKRKLFDSAAQLFAEYDFDDVTIDAIVEAAGVSKGTFYIYFESKDALIASFLFDYVYAVDANYKANLDLLAPETPASDMLLSLTAKIADMITGRIGYNRMRSVYKLMLTASFDTEAVKGYNRELYQIFVAVLKRGVEQGEFSSALSPETLAKHFVLALRGLSYEWCIRYPDLDLKEASRAHVEMLLKGITTRGV
jgi:AcrR family transcriptional regulator